MRASTAVTVAALAAAFAASPQPLRAEQAKHWEDYIARAAPVLERYCIECHDADSGEGEFDIERFRDADDLRARAGDWERAARQIELGEMPPPDEAAPSAAERELLLGWARGFLDDEARRGDGDPGPAVLRRLSNSEYTHTLRDLTGLAELEPARDFAADGAAGEGFTNAAAALSTSPATVEKYLSAAREVAAHAVLLPDGFRFEPGETRQDWANAIVGRIRAIYLRHTGGGEVDFSYRGEVGAAAPASAAEGRFDPEPSFAALRDGDAAGVNARYLNSLREALDAPDDGNVLLGELRRMWREGADAGAMGARARAWQASLWKFNKVGQFGRVRPWQEAVDPLLVGASTRRAPLREGQGQLALGVVGEGGGIWRSPRLVKAGREPLPLAALGEAAERLAALRAELAGSAESYLAAVGGGGAGAGLDADLLAGWRALLGAGGAGADGVLTEFRAGLGGEARGGSWGLPGVPDLSVVANGGDRELRIPGTVPAGAVAAHPRPERPVAVSWRSPAAGTVGVTGAVIDAHHTCGNGFAWRLEHAGGAGRLALAGGEVALGARSEFGEIAVEVAPGDLLTLVIEAKGGDHTCDLTQLEMGVELGGRSWSLAGDCAADLGAGNPHPASGGAAWYFHSPVGDPAAAVPPATLLGRWAAAGEDPGSRSRLAREFGAVLRGESEPPTPEDAALRERLLAPGGALLGGVRLAPPDGAELALRAGEVREFAIPAGLLDGGGWQLVAEVEAAGTGGVQFTVGEALPPGAAARLDPAAPVSVAGEEGAAHWRQHFARFRELFPAALCYTRVVPIDEVVTLLLFHREDGPLAELMLGEGERSELDRLWAELRFVSQEPLRLVTGYEQLWQFATQDGDPTLFEPQEAGIRAGAAAFERELRVAEPAQLDALVDFAARAYRRPPEEEDEAALRALYAELRAGGMGHDEAFRVTLARVLSAPTFLFKVEPVADGATAGAAAPLDGYAMASRLSYFLWASMPDAELMRAAEAGELADPAGLRAQARRMLRDPKARRLGVEFGCQWLGLRDFDQLDEKSERLFPDFAALRGPMRAEVAEFFADLFADDGPVFAVLDGDRSRAAPELAAFYGIESAPGGGVTGLRDVGRGGVLGMAAPLAKYSGASRSSPVLRGAFVYEVLLGQHLPRPPKGVPTLPELPPPGLSDRELVARHSAEPGCARCHDRIDPIGFALEGFDAVGRARPGADTSAVLPGGVAADGLADLRAYLLEERRDAFLRQFCRKLLGYALGRGVVLTDRPLLERMEAALAADGYRVGAAVDEIVASRQFRERRVGD